MQKVNFNYIFRMECAFKAVRNHRNLKLPNYLFEAPSEQINVAAKSTKGK